MHSPNCRRQATDFYSSFGKLTGNEDAEYEGVHRARRHAAATTLVLFIELETLPLIRD